MSKKNRKNRALRIETLENRQLMAADVEARVSDGILNIQGTYGADTVKVWAFQGMTYATRTQGLGIKYIHSGPSSEIKSIVASMHGGTDKIYFDMRSQKIDSIKVDLGTGTRELVDVKGRNVDEVIVNAQASIGTNVFFQGLTAKNTEVFFGDDDAVDSLTVFQSSISKLRSYMGGGNDTFEVSHSSIGWADVKMQGGNDEFHIETVYSQIGSGSVDGGDGHDGYFRRGQRGPGGVSVTNFEPRRRN